MSICCGLFGFWLWGPELVTPFVNWFFCILLQTAVNIEGLHSPLRQGVDGAEGMMNIPVAKDLPWRSVNYRVQLDQPRVSISLQALSCTSKKHGLHKVDFLSVQPTLRPILR